MLNIEAIDLVALVYNLQIMQISIVLSQKMFKCATIQSLKETSVILWS